MSNVPSWVDLLEKGRSDQRDSSGSSSASFMGEVGQFFPHLTQQFSNYASVLRLYRAGIESTQFEDDPPPEGDDKDSVGPFHLRKELIKETRAALRFALSCFSWEESRRTIQRQAIVEYRWHHMLGYTLSQPWGDPKCRVMSARLLSNLVTCNFETASVLASEFSLSPSDETVTARIRHSLSLTGRPVTEQDPGESVNWVDMILACGRAKNRDAVGATVAALHNCLAAAHDDGRRVSLDGEIILLAQNVSSDSVLISTLIRQMLPSSSIVVQHEDHTHADAATEWIVLVLGKLCSLGMTEGVYNSAGGSSGSAWVTPEQLVFLHCVKKAVDDASQLCGQHPLGGEVGDSAVVSTLLFMSRKFCELKELEKAEAATTPSPSGLTKPALSLFSQALASALGTDEHPYLSDTRLRIGKETGLLSHISLELGSVVDGLSVRNTGRKARELEITQEEQEALVNAVRLIGNLCFRCRHNQDLMRMISIPFFMAGAPAGTERTALHVLLTCTSFSFGIFTLREWAVVALRNVLEGNQENQRLVEQLEAQQPVQSAQLQNMGLRVDLDSQGKPRVVPGDKPNGPSSF